MRFESFFQMISYWATRTPRSPALRWAEGGRIHTLSYEALLREVALRSEELRTDCGKCDGYILGERPRRWLPQIFASVHAGRQVVLMNRVTPPQLLREQILSTDVDRLFAPQAFWDEISLDPSEADALYSGDAPEQGAGCLLFFTSGTTAHCKAVVLTERSLCASAWNGASLLPLREQDTLLCALPLDHVFGFVCGVLWGLSCGACVALGASPVRCGEDFARFRPTAVSLVPSQLSALLKHRQLNPELRLTLVGAGDCPWALLKAVHALGIQSSFGYGLTETSSGVALSLGEDPYAMTVCPDCGIRLAEDGEILISSPACMMRGYYRHPEDTEAVLRGGVLHTGDLGALDGEGRLRITGRKKEMLVLSDGTKLFLPEYEKDLARVLETEELAVVLCDGVPALLLRRDACPLTEPAEIRRRVASTMEKLPRSQRLRKLLFTDAPLPRTSTGKLMRWELENAAQEQSPFLSPS